MERSELSRYLIIAQGVKSDPNKILENKKIRTDNTEGN